MNNVTHILGRIEVGDVQATEQLFPIVYRELREIARARMAQEKAGQTLQATALVHEAYLRLVDGEKASRWNSRAHFFAAAGEAMRRILVEAARRKQSQRAGGNWHRLELADVDLTAPRQSVDVLALSEALDQLEAKDARKAALVKLRYFAGLTNREAAAALGVSTATADNDWAYARSWLKVQLSRGSAND